MPKQSSQGRRQTSTHYHDEARQHQEAAHFANRVPRKEPRNAQKARTNAGNRPRGTKT